MRILFITNENNYTLGWGATSTISTNNQTFYKNLTINASSVKL